MKVLVAEDDPRIREGLAAILRQEGYTVVEAADGQEALQLAATENPDLICLDIMMPLVSGYDVCRRLRAEGRAVPIIFVSAKSEELDKVVGLELGADDFIVKPFGVKEVVARVRAVTRRCLRQQSAQAANGRFAIGDLEVWPEELRARRGEDVIELSLREVAILRLLAEHQGRVLSRERIFEACWGGELYPLSRTLDQHMSKLRRRVEQDPDHPRIIQTVHGVGYRYDG